MYRFNTQFYGFPKREPQFDDLDQLYQQQQQQQQSSLISSAQDSRLGSDLANYLTKNVQDSDFGESSNVGGAVLAASTILVAGIIILIGLVGASYYLITKRHRGSGIYSYNTERYGTTTSGANNNGNKILLIGKEMFPTFYEKPYSTGPLAKSTPAVRSPSSGQVNPFNKKTPSPTSGTGATFPAADQNNNNQTVIAIDKNNGNYEANITLKKEPSLDEKSEPKLVSHVETNNEPEVARQQLNLGKLDFKIKYSYAKRALCVVVLKCTELATPSTGSIDPYVKLQLLPEKQHKAKTRVLRKTNSPVYNEEFTFFGVAPNLLETLVVHFVVLNFDRFSRDEIMGEVIVKLNQFEFDVLEKQITLSRDIAPRGNKVQDLGEVLISLCYQPIANRLSVVILKARNLPKMDLTGLCDPYVKIYVFHNGQRIFKKRTHAKKRTLNPVFNESFVFDIPQDEGLDNIQIQFLVYDHDRVTRDELIGKIEIGSNQALASSPSSEKHWYEVIKSPRRQIAEWHKVQEVTSTSGLQSSVTSGV